MLDHVQLQRHQTHSSLESYWKRGVDLPINMPAVKAIKAQHIMRSWRISILFCSLAMPLLLMADVLRLMGERLIIFQSYQRKADRTQTIFDLHRTDKEACHT